MASSRAWRFIVFEGEARAGPARRSLHAFQANIPIPSRTCRERAPSGFTCAFSDRGGTSRRPTCEDPGMGAGAFHRHHRHQSRPRCARARLRRDWITEWYRLWHARARRARGRENEEESPACPYRHAGAAAGGPAAATARRRSPRASAIAFHGPRGGGFMFYETSRTTTDCRAPVRGDRLAASGRGSPR